MQVSIAIVMTKMSTMVIMTLNPRPRFFRLRFARVSRLARLCSNLTPPMSIGRKGNPLIFQGFAFQQLQILLRLFYVLYHTFLICLSVISQVLQKLHGKFYALFPCFFPLDGVE